MMVVSDTSVISNLINIRGLFILKELFQIVHIPKAVYDELAIITTQEKVLLKNSWIDVVNIENHGLRNKFLQNLGKGEAEVITYAISNGSELVLMDERKGRKIAKSEEIKTTGILGLLLKAKEQKIISSVKPYLDSLVYDSSFYISHDLYEEVLKISNEK